MHGHGAQGVPRRGFPVALKPLTPGIRELKNEATEIPISNDFSGTSNQVGLHKPMVKGVQRR